MKRLIYLLIALVLALGAMTPATLRLQARADLDAHDLANLTPAQSGVVTFALHDWGGLSAQSLRTSALPWKLAEAALALRLAGGDPDRAATLPIEDIFRPFGLHVPDSIANWPADLAPPVLDGPLGVVRGQSGGLTPASVEIANTGCAACHSAVVYRADGTPDPTQVWLGGSNSSLNLAAYTDALFDAFLTYGDTPALMDVATARFPHMSWREAATLRYVIAPTLMRELEKRDTTTGRILPFSPSHTGATNGYDALRLRLGLIAQDDVVTQSYFTSIPALGGRVWRNRFLSIGVYTAPDLDPLAPAQRSDLNAARLDAQADILSYFLLPSMGVTAQVAIDQQPRARQVMAWIAEFTPQPYPGPIDRTLAVTGHDIYAGQCARCHGTYDAALDQPTLVSFPNWEGDVGTHAGPPLALTRAVAQAINQSTYAPYLRARPSALRSAPPLTGLWSSAPYLANGSVPTLWHLMRPDARPEQFTTGGHALDMVRVGIQISPADDYVPWADAATFDTTRDGFSNAGHSIGFDGLTEAQKDALLEYLKLL